MMVILAGMNSCWLAGGMVLSRILLLKSRKFRSCHGRWTFAFALLHEFARRELRWERHLHAADCMRMTKNCPKSQSLRWSFSPFVSSVRPMQ